MLAAAPFYGAGYYGGGGLGLVTVILPIADGRHPDAVKERNPASAGLLMKSYQL